MWDCDKGNVRCVERVRCEGGVWKGRGEGGVREGNINESVMR